MGIPRRFIISSQPLIDITSIIENSSLARTDSHGVRKKLNPAN